MKKKNKIGQEVIVLIRPSEDCSYSDIVDAMDEMMITNVDKWILMDADKAEYELVRNR